MPKLLVAGEEDQFDANKSVESLEFSLPKPSEIKIYPDDHFWLNEVEKMTGDVNDFFVDLGSPGTSIIMENFQNH